MVKARYQITIALDEERYKKLQDFRKKGKWTNIEIFDAGMDYLMNMVQKGKDMVLRN